MIPEHCRWKSPTSFGEEGAEALIRVRSFALFSQVTIGLRVGRVNGRPDREMYLDTTII